MAKRPVLCKPAVSPYERYDAPVMFTAYNVYATVKKKPLIPNQSDKHTIISYIEQHVTAKEHFEFILIEAQRRRNVETSATVPWVDRHLIDGHEDIYAWKLVDN